MSEDSTTAATGDGAASARQDAGADVDPKERFRQALERKNAAGHRTADGVRGGSAVHGSEVAGGGKRTFRRKTG